MNPIRHLAAKALSAAKVAPVLAILLLSSRANGYMFGSSSSDPISIAIDDIRRSGVPHDFGAGILSTEIKLLEKVHLEVVRVGPRSALRNVRRDSADIAHVRQTLTSWLSALEKLPPYRQALENAINQNPASPLASQARSANAVGYLNWLYSSRSALSESIRQIDLAAPLQENAREPYYAHARFIMGEFNKCYSQVSNSLFQSQYGS